MKILTLSLTMGLLSSYAYSNQLQSPITPVKSSVIKMIRNSNLPSIDDPGAILTFPVLNDRGTTVGSKKVPAKDIWPSMDQWTSNVEKTYSRTNGPKTTTTREWDSDLNANIESFQIPQDIEQGQNLDKQQAAAKNWQPLKQIERQKISTSLNRTFGNNSTFGVFQNGGFSTEGETTRVKVDQSFSAGGFVFGQRLTVLSETTKSDSRSKTTRSDIKVFDQSVFVSNDGAVRGNKSFTRSKGAAKTFVLGIIPVKVEGKVAGSMGANYDYKTGELSIAGSVAPFVNTKGTASAGINLLLVIAGIEGSLTFIDTSVASAFNTIVDPIKRELRANLKVDHRLNLLSGKISVFAKIRRLLRRDKKFSKTIFSFSGINENRNLINERMTQTL